ncbi:MAG: hypothetical protein LBS65_02120 [Desulfovibrio sp.]|jgi:hypothetical protein|nr:hypothetical protein [Desulfovibrio sp.]
MSEKNEKLSAYIALLRERHGDIRALEEKALAALDEDVETYRRLMAERAERIAGLADAAVELRRELPETARLHVEAALRRFSAYAREALRLKSVFYMSALLYPDTHRPGGEDNLQKLIADLEKQTG